MSIDRYQIEDENRRIIVMNNMYRIYCVSCGEFLKQFHTKKRMSFKCEKCGHSFSTISTNNFVSTTERLNLKVVMPYTQKSEGDFSTSTPSPKYTDVVITKDKLPRFPLYCIFCRRTMEGKIIAENSIIYNYSCGHCKRDYLVSFMIKEKETSA